MNNLDPRVAVALDVIKQVKAQKYDVLSSNGYMDLVLGDDAPRNAWHATELQHIVDLPMSKCEVCAKGAMILSYARLFNSIPVGSRGDDSDVYWYKEGVVTCGGSPSILQNVFGENAETIECAFEGWLDYGSDKRNTVEFYNRYPNDADRLIAIMQNIVDNNGVFIP